MSVPSHGLAVLRPALVPLASAARGAGRVAARRAAGERALRVAGRLAGAPTGLRWLREPDRPPLARDAAGRPAPWQASLANTPHLAAALVAPFPVGLDAEPLDRPRWEAARTRLAETGEPALMGACDREATLSLWTAREACLKRAGLGLAGFDRLRLSGREGDHLTFLLDGARLRVRILRAHGHVIAIAVASDVALEVRLASPAEVST